MIILLLSLLTIPAFADDAIFDRPAGDPIYVSDVSDCSRETYGSATKDSYECFGADDEHTENFVRVTLNGGAGPSWGTDGQTHASGSLNVNGIYKGWSDHRQYDGIYPNGGVGAQAGARVSIQNLGGTPLYQMKLEATGTARMFVIPLGGFYLAVEKDSFNRYSRSLAQLGYTQALSFRIGKTGYVLLRYVYVPLSRGNINAENGATPELANTIAGFKGPEKDAGVFPFNTFSATGDLSETSHSGSLLLQLAKFAIRVDVTFGNAQTRRDETVVEGETAPQFAPTGIKRFDAYASVVMPLKMIFPNDSLQIEGRYVSMAFEGDPSLPEQKQQTADGSFGVFYGLSW